MFVADSIGAELRRIIEFLNSQMSRTEVLAIEVKQHTDAQGAHQTIVPRVIGDTAEARAVKRPTALGERLDRETLIASVREQSARAADAAEALLAREPRVDSRYTRTRGFIERAGQPLLKLYTTRSPEKVELRPQTLARRGEP